MFKSLSKTSIISIFLAMGIIYGLTSFSSVGVELLKNGFAAGLLDRDVPIIWTGEKLKATGMSASMIYFLILPGVIMTNKERLSLFWKLILLALFAIAVLCTFRLGSRTGIAIIIITILFTIILQLRTKNNAQKIKFLLQIAIIIFLVLKFVPFDLDADYLSVLGDRLQNPHGNSTESAGGRTDLWENAIGNLFAHPLGWKSSIYNHNLWLDIAMTNGILPLVLLMIFNVFNFINLRKVLFHKQSDLGINSLFLLFNLATFLQFFVEPIYQGSFFLFSFYCLFQGCIKRYLELSHYGNVYQKPKKKVRI
ncbi:MAG: O-antigen ligase family protein [Flavobacteriaceae bacterium]